MTSNLKKLAIPFLISLALIHPAKVFAQAATDADIGIDEDDISLSGDIFSDFNEELDASKITFPLRLRKMKSDDVFFPKGMKGKKKVSKFFKDEKISILAKPKIWLLCDGSDNILGIIPLRQDRRFAENSGSHRIFKFYLT